MSSHTTSLSDIPVLQGTTNYTDWALEIEAAAQLGKFWRAFTGKNDPIDSSATAAENAANREEAALGLIKKTVIKTTVKELRSFPDPSDSEKTITNGTVRNMVFFELFLCYFSRLSMLFYPSRSFLSVSLFQEKTKTCAIDPIT